MRTLMSFEIVSGGSCGLTARCGADRVASRDCALCLSCLCLRLLLKLCLVGDGGTGGMPSIACFCCCGMPEPIFLLSSGNRLVLSSTYPMTAEPRGHNCCRKLEQCTQAVYRARRLPPPLNYMGQKCTVETNTAAPTTLNTAVYTRTRYPTRNPDGSRELRLT